MPDNWQENLSPGRIATLACLLEVAAPKPGNVHRGADFEDTTLTDFMVSAVALGQSIDSMQDESLGATILEAVTQSRCVAGSNTNLGMILLICPLAKCAGQRIGANEIRNLLEGLDEVDAELTFEAIRTANPGGLGSVDEMDVNDKSRRASDLIEAMALAAPRDLVARQYANGFSEILGPVSQSLLQGVSLFEDVSQAIVFAHVQTMANFPDSLIGRKCGDKLARQSQAMAARIVDGYLETKSAAEFWKQVGEMDFWLRSDGHRRNPGTTADLVAAAIYVALRNNNLRPPF